MLLVLELLALAHQRRGDHHLGPLEGADVLVATGGHRGFQRPHQVEGAVVLLRRAEQDLLHRPVLLGRDAGAARQRGMEGRHPPVEAATGCLLGAGEGRADHHRVGAAGDRLGDVAAGPHAAVADHVHVLAGLQHVLGPGRGDVGDRGRLRDADPEHAAGGAGGAGADPDQDADRPGPHQVQAGRVGGAAADDRRHRHLGDELLQVQRLDRGRDVFGGDHGALDDEDVEAGLDRHLVVLAHFLRRQRAADDGAAGLDLLDPLADQLGLDRLGVDLLHDPRRLVLGRGGDLLQQLLGVLEAGPDPLEVEHSEAAELVDAHRGIGADDAVHRRREQGHVEAVRTEGPADVDVVRVPGPARRDDCDVVESVCAPAFLAATNFDFQVSPSRAGVEPPAYTSAGTSKSCTATSPSRRSTWLRSTVPAPKCWVDSAPQATP